MATVLQTNVATTEVIKLFSSVYIYLESSKRSTYGTIMSCHPTELSANLNGYVAQWHTFLLRIGEREKDVHRNL